MIEFTGFGVIDSPACKQNVAHPLLCARSFALGPSVCSQMCSQMRFYFDRVFNQMVGLSCKHDYFKDINGSLLRLEIVSFPVLSVYWSSFHMK